MDKQSLSSKQSLNSSDDKHVFYISSLDDLKDKKICKDDKPVKDNVR